MRYYTYRYLAFYDTVLRKCGYYGEELQRHLFFGTFKGDLGLAAHTWMPATPGMEHFLVWLDCDSTGFVLVDPNETSERHTTDGNFIDFECVMTHGICI